ncbi:putative ribosomal protein L27/L41 [Arabidopsis thaliana]
MTLGLLLGIGRTFRRKRASSLDILSPKRAPRDFYKGQNCKPLGFHTRKGFIFQSNLFHQHFFSN